MSHSPLPWIAEYDNSDISAASWYNIAPADQSCSIGQINRPNDKDFVLLAANHHHELTEALRQLAEYAANAIGVPLDECVSGPIAKARNILDRLEVSNGGT